MLTGAPSSAASGQLTVTFGQTLFGMQSEQVPIVTSVLENEMQPQPSSTSTVAVYLPGPTPLRSQLTLAPSPVTRPPVTVYVYSRVSPSGSVALAVRPTDVGLAGQALELERVPSAHGRVIDGVEAVNELIN